MAASTTFSQVPQGQSPHRFELAASHKVFFWPKVTEILRNLRSNLEEDLQPLREGGTAWLVERNLAERTITGHTRSLGPQSPSEASGPVLAHEYLGSWQMNEESVRRSVDAYFSSFNMMHPMLDLNDFLRKVAQPILSGDQNGGQIEAILLLLVSALGQAAIAGYAKEPVHREASLPSGFRGGSLTEHPGQNDFAEAERRLHSIRSRNSLEHLQAHTLLAMYKESHADHLGFWRAASDASRICAAILRTSRISWTSEDQEMLRRAYWICVLNEGYYHLDLDLPRTEIFQFQDEMPLPFGSESGEGLQDSLSPTDRDCILISHSLLLAAISMKRLTDNIQIVVHEDEQQQRQRQGQDRGLPRVLISEMLSQLETWRSLLPPQLQWSDEARYQHRTLAGDGIDYADVLTERVDRRIGMDIGVADMQSRYYRARSLLLRPFVYQLLHNPDDRISGDDHLCAEAIRAMLWWPMFVEPTRSMKRLTPHHFTWTQAVLAHLCIFATIRHDDRLKELCEANVDLQILRSTVAQNICWLEDLSVFDGIASWGWRLLQPHFIVSRRATP